MRFHLAVKPNDESRDNFGVVSLEHLGFWGRLLGPPSFFDMLPWDASFMFSWLVIF